MWTRRFGLVAAVLMVGGLSVGCGKAEAPKEPAPKEGNIKAGKPAESRAGQLIQEAEKAKDAQKARAKEIGAEAEKAKQ